MSAYSLAILCLLFLAACGGNIQNILPIPLSENPSEAAELSEVKLVSISEDLDGYITEHNWSQIKGSPVNLIKENETTVSFIAPDVAVDTVLSFSLTVVDNESATQTSESIDILIRASLADKSSLSALDLTENNTATIPFLSTIEIETDKSLLSHIQYTIKPKPDAKADELSVTYSIERLTYSNNKIITPVFGLYDDYSNTVNLLFTFLDGSAITISKDILTEQYIHPDTFQITEPVDANQKPSFSYYYLKTFDGPVVLDIDGAIRWVSTEGRFSTYLAEMKFFFGKNGQFGTMPLDGEVTLYDIESNELSNINLHHDISKGKAGHLVQVDGSYDGGSTMIIESILLEVDDSGKQLRLWDMGEIITEFMLSKGDNPSEFVRDGIDWFHMNSAIYDEADNSLIVSSRENFVIKIDYTSKEIKWVLGDETKHWYQNFPSLRSISISSLDTKPIGQHSLSIVGDDLMLFNNGFPSLHEPSGEPKGIELSESIISKYRIDAEEKTATITFDFSSGKYSDICSSVYLDEFAQTNPDYLITYSIINRLERQKKNLESFGLVKGVDTQKQKLFELKIIHGAGRRYGCKAGWNANTFPSSFTFN